MIKKSEQKINRKIKKFSSVVGSDFLSAKDDVFFNVIEAISALGGSEIHCEPHNKKLLIRWRSSRGLKEFALFDSNQSGLFLEQLHNFFGLSVNRANPFQEGQKSFSLGQGNWQLYVSLLMTSEGGRYFLRLIRPEEYSLRRLAFLDVQAGAFSALSRAGKGLVAVGALKSADRQLIMKSLAAEAIANKAKIAFIADQPIADWSKAEYFRVRPEIGFGLSVAVKAAIRSDFNILLIDAQIKPADLEVILEAANGEVKVLISLAVDSAPKLFQYLWHFCQDKESLRQALFGLVVAKNLNGLCRHCRQPKILSEQGRRVLSGLLHDLPRGRGTKPPALANGKWQAYVSGHGCEYCQDGGGLAKMPVYEVVRFKMIKSWPAGSFNVYELVDKRGLINLRQAAVLKALAGEVDLTEALSF
jgi:general secretion pathway protein E